MCPLCPPTGSEVKTMLSKLRGQLEEMKCKVQFLGLVKKYLQASPPHPAHPLPQHLVAEASQTEAPASPHTQVMYAERWGLESPVTRLLGVLSG